MSKHWILVRNATIFAALAAVIAIGLAGPSFSQGPAHSMSVKGAKLAEGSVPPPLKGTFVKGAPFTLEKGKLYVVEFWATWCPPCKESIPHLTQLQAKYKDKVKFVGVSVWEDQDPVEKGKTYLGRVKDFVKSEGKAMSYTVVADDDKGKMATSWMEAAKQDGIPVAFIIGKNGKVAWIGSPFEIEGPLAKIAG